MLTKLILKNFKRFKHAQIDLGKSVVFIGPNNSGKTTALQALALWDIGLRSWLVQRSGKASPAKRPGVNINRRDLVSVPVPLAKLLWHELHVRNVIQEKKENGKTKPKTSNIRLEVTVEGITEEKLWSCGFEFDFSNEESFACRPIRLKGFEDKSVAESRFTEVPDEAKTVRVGFLPPMSGLIDREFVKQSGEIAYLIGQGQTAQVLRNICARVYENNNKGPWQDIVDRIEKLFGVTLQAPEHLAEKAEITMEYRERGTKLDLSSSGRGLQQTLLLLAYLYENPKSVLLLDEPDAHLEILRQRQTYQFVTEVAEQQGSQVIAASHSEVILNEAAGKGKVVAFVGSPHTINDRRSQLVKSLTDIGWDLYYQAETTGWLLCVEGPTDLEILRVFARTLNHAAADLLERPFVHYVASNIPEKARHLFFGLKEAKDDLIGIAIFDNLQTKLQQSGGFFEYMWERREIENYLCREDVLLAYARIQKEINLFSWRDSERRLEVMIESIKEVTEALATLGKPSPWSPDIKATDDFLDPLFKSFFKKLELPISFRKSDYFELASFVKKNEIDPEIVQKLDRIVEVAKQAKPASD